MPDTYESPLNSRYASREMKYIFSPDHKFRLWRRLWIALARAEMQLGLPVTQEQIDEMEQYKDDINYDVAAAKEKEVRHDVMAHVHAYGAQCKKAMPIIHLGATSCYVGDNADLIIMRDGLQLVRKKLLTVMDNLAKFADTYKDMPTLGFTHFQSAQLTTVGKRASLWLWELVLDFQRLEFELEHLLMLGSKGTTGTQASFMELFGGDEAKIKKMEALIADEMGFQGVYPVSGQTYSRKVDSNVLNVLSGIAQSAYKFANDMRLLQHLKEMEEPFEKHQIGSSAMAYKRNPMRCERICALSRYVMVDALNPAMTASTQWFERTLDDSANKRLSVAEGFLAVDAILNIFMNVTANLVVYPKVIEKRIMSELPFMATENILMDAVKKGGNRQELHEKIRVLSMEAAAQVKQEGKENDLLDRIAADPAFALTKEDMQGILDPKLYIGRAPSQVSELLAEVVNPILDANRKDLSGEVELTV